MGPEPDKDGVLVYRLGQVEDDVKDVLTWRRDVDTDRTAMREQIRVNTELLARTSDQIESVKRTLVGFAITIAASAIIFSFSILVSSGKI
jgi:hypothetical protein